MTSPLYERHAFELPDDVTYLNGSYMSPLLKEVRKAGEGALEDRARPWTISSEKFFDNVERVRSLFAVIINGDPDGVALIPSVSFGAAVAAANLPIKEGQKILVMEGQFPSNFLVWRELAKRTGGILETVPCPKDFNWTEAFLSRLDDRTAIVALEPCHWTNGSSVDLGAVGNRTREVGGAFVVDASQAAGALPLDVREFQPDFLLTVGYKWLLGPYSLALMYVHPSRRSGIPLEFNWMNLKGSQDFTRLTDYGTEFQEGARRYDVGERSNFLLVPMLKTALEKIVSWGIPQIQKSAASLTALIDQSADRRGIERVPSSRRVGHMTGLYFQGKDLSAIANRLAAEKIFVSLRGSSIRISANIYNSSRDIERLFEVLS